MKVHKVLQNHEGWFKRQTKRLRQVLKREQNRDDSKKYGSIHKNLPYEDENCL